MSNGAQIGVALALLLELGVSEEVKYPLGVATRGCDAGASEENSFPFFFTSDGKDGLDCYDRRATPL